MTKKEAHNDKSTIYAVPWIAGVLLVLGLAVLGGFYWNRTGKIDEVQYKGFYYTTKAQLQKQASIPTGVHPDSLDLMGIMKKIEKIAYVKRAGIDVQPGGTMVVNVAERTPIAMLVDGQRRAYVDADGIRLAHVPGKTPDVPILYGFKARPMRDTLKSDEFRQTSAFLQALQQRKASDATISEVAWNGAEGIVALTNENGVKVIFGKGEFDKRLRNWEAFCREVIRRKGIDNMRSVDLRFEGQIVTREKE